MKGTFKPIPTSGKAWKSLKNSSAKRQGWSSCIFILIQIDGRTTMGRKQHPASIHGAGRPLKWFDSLTMKIGSSYSTIIFWFSQVICVGCIPSMPRAFHGLQMYCLAPLCGVWHGLQIVKIPRFYPPCSSLLVILIVSGYRSYCKCESVIRQVNNSWHMLN